MNERGSLGNAMTPLGELCELCAGTVFKPDFQGNSSGKFPFVKVSDMNLPGNDIRITVANHWVDEEARQALKARPFPPGTTVFAKIGEALKQNRLRYLIRDTIIDNNMMGAIPDPAKVDPRFFYYVLSRIDFSSIASGTALPYLTVGDLSRQPLPVPSLDVQAGIASVLQAIDDKFELNRRTSQTLEAMAEALFKSWFIDFEPLLALKGGLSSEEVARGFAIQPETLHHFETELLSVEGQPLPAGWRISSLGEEVQAHGGLLQTGPFGSQLHASDYADAGIPVVMPQDMVGRRITTTRIARVPEEVADSLSRHKLHAGDIVYSRRGDVERHARVTSREMGWLCGTGCLLVRMGSAWASPAYLSELLNHGGTREWIVRHAVGATMPNLNTSILSALPILMPPQELLQQFERVVAPLMAQQEALSAEAESLIELRNELLPRLLSGELLVP